MAITTEKLAVELRTMVLNGNSDYQVAQLLGNFKRSILDPESVCPDCLGRGAKIKIPSGAEVYYCNCDEPEEQN
jgi:hypothetical protein